MKKRGSGAGPGIGIKDFRSVIVFHSADALDSFVEDGQLPGAENENGGVTCVSVTLGDITVYEPDVIRLNASGSA